MGQMPAFEETVTPKPSGAEVAAGAQEFDSFAGGGGGMGSPQEFGMPELPELPEEGTA